MGHTDADFGEVSTQDDALLQDGVVADLDVVGALDEALLADQVFGSRLVELLLFVGHLPFEDVQGLGGGLLLARDDLAGLAFADGAHLHKLLLSLSITQDDGVGNGYNSKKIKQWYYYAALGSGLRSCLSSFRPRGSGY
jgi:hypothetical protein